MHLPLALRAILFLFSASLALHLAFSSTFHHALSSCLLAYRLFLPPFATILAFLQLPLNLFILLNLVLITIVLKSGVLSSAKQQQLPEAFQFEKHRFGPLNTQRKVGGSAEPNSSPRVLMNVPLHKGGSAQVVLIEDSYVGKRPDEQLVHIRKTDSDSGELSTEELNRRADAYLSNFRKVLSLERQASLNRLNGFMSSESTRVR